MDIRFEREQLNIAGLEVKGISQAGIGTALYFPQLKICFDVASGFQPAIPCSHFFITHGHMDHASGIPYMISQSALNEMNPPVFLMPQMMLNPLSEIMRQWSSIEGFQYKFEFKAVEQNPSTVIKNKYKVEWFPTVHRIPSVGYKMSEVRKKLKPEYSNLSGSEIKELRESGNEIEIEVNLPLFAYTGDTQIEVFQKSPELLATRFLFLEVTYFDEKRNVQEAKKWGHVHFDEVLPLLPQFNGDKLVLIHSSRRYTCGEVEQIVNRKVPQELKNKIMLFGRTS